MKALGHKRRARGNIPRCTGTLARDDMGGQRIRRKGQ
jgi:hypothetical protein